MNNQDRLILDKEQLNDLVNSCQKEIRRLKEENQRLNNVLNKIYDDLMFDYKDLDVKKLKLDGMDNSITDLTDSYWLGYIHACEEVFDRINELKESDK